MQSSPDARTDEKQQHISSRVIAGSPVGGEDKDSPFHLSTNVRAPLQMVRFSLFEGFDRQAVGAPSFPLSAHAVSISQSTLFPQATPSFVSRRAGGLEDAALACAI